jgi:glycolate oxidase FAD binding subunit
MTLAYEANLSDEAKGGDGAKSEGGDGAKSAPPLSATGTETGTASAFDELRTIGSQAQWRDADPDDTVAGVQPRMVFEPQNEAELAAALRVANAAGLGVIPRGGGSKDSWGNPPVRADLILSTARLNRIIEHAWADLTVSVEAGCTFATLQNTLAQHGQRIAVDPLWPEHGTVGGILSTNDSGTLRIRYGGLRDLVIGVTIALPDGTLASSGGKVVKNVAGYDLPKLVTGALGTLGVITRAVFRLHPLPQNIRTFTFAERDWGNANQLMLAVQGSKLAHTGLQVRLASGQQPQVDVRFDGTEAGLAAQSEAVQKLAVTPNETEPNDEVWQARERLFGISQQGDHAFAIVKCSVLPGSIAATCDQLRDLSEPLNVGWEAVIQGTGLGYIRFEASQPLPIHQAMQAIRARLELGGSAVVLYRSPGIPEIDAWGDAGDAFPLMLKVKEQLDPKKTLNPGRFVGGI